MTFGLIVGNRGFFPDHLAKTGREQMIAAHRARRPQGGLPHARTDQARRGGDPRRSATVRRPVSRQSRPDRRHHRHAAEFRRGARDRRSAAHGRSARAGPHPGDARHAGPHDHRRPPRQLLRQDERLQQPPAVPDSLLAHDAAHRGAGFAGVRARTSRGSRPSAAWRNGLRKLRIGAIGARPAAFNTVRYSEKILEVERHHDRAARPLRSLRPDRPPEVRRSRRAGEGARDPRSTSRPTASPTTPS